MHCAECLVQNCQVQCKQPGGADCPMKDQALFDAILAEYQKPDTIPFMRPPWRACGNPLPV